MNAKRTIGLLVGCLLLAGIVVGTIMHSRSGVQAVVTSKAVREDLVATVSGTGQIKPKTYVNVGATAFGRITHLYVKEGDHVAKGTVLATLENVQPTATVAAQQATISASRTDLNSFVAAEKTAAANTAAAKADLEQKQLDFNRSQQLYNEKLIAKQDYDSKKAAFDMATATLAQREAAAAQAQAQSDSARGHIGQAVASQRANYDALDKTISRAPFDALVTNVPVREGETMVTGIQNAQGSTLMTLADMSVITAEVKVDETDIVNVKMDQSVDVTIDALPGKVLKGHVTEVGDQALLRTTGVATSQSTTGTEEAKDFKVVVTLDQTAENQQIELRPGLSCTAKITTARKPNTLTIPIQALVQRSVSEEQALFNNKGKPVTNSVQASGAQPALTQGVYMLVNSGGTLRARFTPVSTGITGTTTIEVINGIKSGDELVTGRYKILRTLKSGTAVKRDTSLEGADDASSSSSS